MPWMLLLCSLYILAKCDALPLRSLFEVAQSLLCIVDKYMLLFHTKRMYGQCVHAYIWMHQESIKRVLRERRTK